nr:MAG TPA: hypothetical protein [Caudoviricetes sp.]
MDLSLPFAYWHYSIRNSEMQYSRKNFLSYI